MGGVVRAVPDGRAEGHQRAARELAGRIKVVKVDVDRAPRTAARLDARSIPTLLMLRDGQVVARQVGALPADRLVAWAGSVARQASDTGS